MRYAAIDIGTNSCRLLIAEIREGRLFPLCKKIKTTRLGERLEASGEISFGAVKRAVFCLQEFKSIVDKYEVKIYQAVATSAIREASNRDEFLSLAENRCGLLVKIISGEEEAWLSYWGVKRGLDLKAPPLVADLGGGSTELILRNGEQFLMSLPIGAVKATESNMSPAQIENAVAKISKNRERFARNPLVFVGGTATSLVAIKKSLQEYRSDLVHGQVLTREEIAAIYSMLENMPLVRRRELPGLQPERADIILQGILILVAIMDALGKKEITVSDSDLLEGIVWQLQEKSAVAKDGGQ